MLIGGRDVGEALVDDHRVPLVSATGSTAHGPRGRPARSPRASPARSWNSAATTPRSSRPSADLDLALRAIAFAAIGTAGQRCTTLRRLFVHESVYDTLVPRLQDGLRQRARSAIRCDDGTLVGPLIDRPAFDGMQQALAEARAAGGTVHGGGRARGRPAAATPSTCARRSSRCRRRPARCCDETFAPILYVMRYRDFDEAIALHNAVPQGLSSSIFTLDLREAERFLSADGLRLRHRQRQHRPLGRRDRRRVRRREGDRRRPRGGLGRLEGLHAPRHQHDQLRHDPAAGAGRDVRHHGLRRGEPRAPPAQGLPLRPKETDDDRRRPAKAKDKPAPAAFQWDDPFLLEDQLTEDERLIRDTARAYAQEKLLPRVIEAYAEEKTDRAIFSEMGELGLLGVTLPEEYGCAGATYVSYGLVAREVERVDFGYRSMMSVQSSLVCTRSTPMATRRSARSTCRSSPRGEWVGCFGLTEPDAGSDPAGMKTRAEKVADGYRLTGSKMWISNSPIADVFVVWAKSAAHGDQIRGFVLEKGMKGLSRAEDRGQAVAARLDHRRDRDGRRRGAARSTCCPTSPASRARSAASTAPATASPGA